MTLAFALLLGAMAGWLSARQAEHVRLLSGKVVNGAWQAWPSAGRADALPYARLHYQMRGQLPPSPFEQLEFTARHDDEGRRLRAECTYVLRGAAPVARLWLLGAHPLDDTDAKASYLLASDTLTGADGSIEIRLARRMQSGNWLRLPRQGDFEIVLRLFGLSPLERERMLKRPPLRITREECS